MNTTKNYSKFRFFDRNREVNKGQVEKLRIDMAKRGQLQRILINEKGYVLDGQHRIAALKQDNKTVDFYVKKGGSIEDITAINNIAKPWKNSDWLNNFSNKEHLNYQNYLDYASFREKYSFTESVCMLLLSEDNHDYGRKSFKDGTFSVVSFNRACKTADQLSELLGIEPKLNVLKAVVAFLNIKKLNNFKFDVLKSQLEKNKKRLSVCNNAEHWVDTFVNDIYNYNLKKPNIRLVIRLI